MFWRTAPKKEPLDLERVKKAIVRVGPNGRGFMTGGTIVTTAHLLPNYPKFKYQFGTQGEWDEALTDELLLGRLGEKLTVKARCTFADPFSNIAMVSGSSEGYRSFEYWEDRLPIHAPLRPHIAGAGRAQVAWIFSIDCKWIQCVVKTNYDYLTFVDDPPEIKGGMSGSPIINEEGGAIGIIVVPKKDQDEWADHHQVLVRCLPGRMIEPISSLAYPERPD